MKNTRHVIPKGLTVVLAMTSIVLVTPVSAFASSAATATATGNASTGDLAQPKLSPKQAEAILRSTFQIPASYQVQNESFHQASPGNPNSVSTYSFNFAPAVQNSQGDTYYATLDANTGQIINYNQYGSAQNFQFPVPTSQEQAKSVAIEWAKKLFPKQYPQTKMLFEPSRQNSLHTAVLYQFSFERIVNGIPAPFNGFTITINQTGHLSQVNDAWSNMDFTGNSPDISRTKANQVYKSSLQLHLNYDQVWHQSGKPTSVLSYVPASPQSFGYWNMQFNNQYNVNGPVISAVSGDWTNADGTKPTMEPYQPPVPLVTDGPTQDPLKVTANWTEQQALSYATKVIGLPTGAKLTNASQWQAQQNDETWQFTWQTSDGTRYNTTVDATHGFLQNYNEFSPPQPGQPPSPLIKESSATTATATKKSPLSNQALQQKAEDFVKQVLASDTGAVSVSPVRQPPNVPNNNPGSFQIQVLVNGIPDQMESGSLNLDPQTGQVRNYWFNTGASTSTALPLPNKAISKTKAQNIWVQNHPLQLMYLETTPMVKQPEAGTQTTSQPKVMLVYAPTSQINLGVLNAVTGEFETSGQPAPYSGPINDLNGVAAAPQIRLLVQRGLLSVDANGDVHPNQQMTNSAFVKLLIDSLSLTNYYSKFASNSTASAAALANVPSASPNYHEIQAAYAIGLIPLSEKFQPDALITRSFASQLIARVLSLKPLLSHPEAFAFNPKDKAQIQNKDLAADALMVTLGIFPLVNGNFNPNSPIPLAEAAAAIVQTANVGAQMNLIGTPHPLP